MDTIPTLEHKDGPSQEGHHPQGDQPSGRLPQAGWSHSQGKAGQT